MLLSELKVLSEDEIIKIHEASLEILRSTGIKICNKKVLDFLGNFNSIIIDKFSSIVKFSPEIFSTVLKNAPSSFNLFGQDKKINIEIGKKNFHLINGHCAAFFNDFSQNKRRRILKNEVEKFAILSDFLENIGIVGIEGLPEDIDDERMSFIEGARLTLSNILKPFHYTPEHIFEDEGVKEIVRIITDFKDISTNPSIICMVVNLSPLAWPDEIAEILLKNSFEGIPITIMTAPYSGVSAPYTLAGQVALFNAEILSGIAINQMARPGCPVVYGCSCTTFDMNKSTVNIATPEAAIMRIAAAQMARYYNIPSMTSAPDTESNCFDEQNGWEKIMTAFTSSASGVNLIVNAGLFSTGTEVSFGQLIIDSEITGYVKRIIEGIKVDHKRLAVEEIKDVGPLGNFLLTKHTLEYLRKDKLFKPVVSSRNMHSQWENQGSLTVNEKAHKEALKILKIHKPTYIDNEKIKEIKKLIKNIKVVNNFK